jgi:hypothetical protein
MFRILLYAFLIYLAYQFIFNFLVPVYRATQKIKNGFRNMKDQNDFTSDQPHSTSQQKRTSTDPKEPVGDYIDFEEIK